MYKFLKLNFPHQKFNLNHNHNQIFKNSKFFSQKVKLDPYLILEINRNADWKIIKKAYFKLARLYHPDLNKNDERAQKKFLQVKEAYEHFERKYVPEKYINNKQSFSSRFDEESSSKTEEGEESKKEDGFESIREKKKKNKREKTSEKENFEFRHDDKNIYGGSEDSANYFKDEQFKNELEKQKNINRFLFLKIPVPRSPKMVDRLSLNKITIAKGKMFGPEDYLSFSFITILLFIIFMDRKEHYKTYNFDNLENVNIYNALKPSEVTRIYEENEISPTEKIIIDSKEHKEYKEEMRRSEFKDKMNLAIGFGRINDVPKLDIKKQFKESIAK